MRILILEDSRERIALMRRRLIGHVAVFVDIAADAIARLEQESWDALFLDHDLGGEEMVESGPGTGYEVAKWLERNPDKKPREIWIHSLNPIGRKNMKCLLPEAGLAPGWWLDG